MITRQANILYSAIGIGLFAYFAFGCYLGYKSALEEQEMQKYRYLLSYTSDEIIQIHKERKVRIYD